MANLILLIKKTSFFREARFLYLSAFKRHHLLRCVLNRFYYAPKIKQLRIADWQLPATDAYSFHTLCGHQHLLMLAWSLASWLYQTRQLPKIYLHSDGSLTATDEQILKAIFPSLSVIDPAIVTPRILSELHHYPHIYDYREHYLVHPIYLPKLIDPYFISPAPFQLFFDVDVLFFSRPDEVLKNIHSGLTFMTPGNLDMFTTAGLAGFRFADGTVPANTPGFLNGGIVGYSRTSFSLSALDYFFDRCGRDNNYRLIEQAGYAYVLSRNPDFRPLDMRHYQIKGPVNEQTAAKHYTGPRREEFWLEGIDLLRHKILSYGQ